ncbi:MAG: hypothetical protein IH969_03085 [Candidatus Krumholzibacteriota bacterium]|nr:hypothetical protein [Candidatus Krumholzibacteriota bacterium]
MDFGGGPLTSADRNNIFLAKFGGSGTHLWSRRFGVPQGIAVDGSGNVYMMDTRNHRVQKFK